MRAATFASKLLATIDPGTPVIDSVVLRNLGLRPAHGSARRTERIEELHARLVACFGEFLPTENGRYLVGRFREENSGAEITKTKMVDFVLWQTRTGKPITADSAAKSRCQAASTLRRNSVETGPHRRPGPRSE